MKGTLLKPIDDTTKDGQYVATARDWIEKYWLVDTNLALDEAWRREYPYDTGREAPNITMPELIEHGMLDAHEVDLAIAEWLNLPWTPARGSEKYAVLFACGVTVVLDTIASVKTLVLARKTLCDRLPILLAWVAVSVCCKGRQDWIRRRLLDTVIHLPERNGRYVELYRERLETVEPTNDDYFAVVFAPGGVWDRVAALAYLNSLGQLFRRRRMNCPREAEADLKRVGKDVRKKYCAGLVEERLAQNDEKAKRNLESFFHLLRYGVYDPLKGRVVILWEHPDQAQANRNWLDTSDRVSRFIVAQNVFAPFRHR